MPSIYHIPQPIAVYTGSTSTATSAAFMVQDYNTISVQLVSQTTIMSLQVQGSNDDGMQSAIINWSTLTSMLSSGGTGSSIYSTTGVRWLRFGSPISACTVLLSGNAF